MTPPRSPTTRPGGAPGTGMFGERRADGSSCRSFIDVEIWGFVLKQQRVLILQQVCIGGFGYLGFFCLVSFGWLFLLCAI